jgi:hypothetical protein
VGKILWRLNPFGGIEGAMRYALRLLFGRVQASSSTADVPPWWMDERSALYGRYGGWSSFRTY